MALTIGDNFSYQGAKPLDTRLQYATIAEMASKADSTLYDGIIAYCKADSKNYQWKSTNEVDPTLGKWRELFGDLAEKDNASGSYTPEGTVTPSVTGTQTATVNSITAVGTLPTVTYADGGIIFNPGTLPTKGADQTVISDIGTVSATFSGTAKAVTVS